MAASKKLALPPLLFGNERAQLHTSARLFAEQVDTLFPGVNAYDPLPQTEGVFRSTSAQVKLDGVSLLSASISPTYVDRFKNQVLTLLLPVSGDPWCTAQVGSDSVHWGLQEGGVLLPVTDERVTGTGGFRNQIMIQVDAGLLQRHAQAMLGKDATAPDLRLDHIRRIPLHYGKTPLLQGIFQTIPLMSNYVDQPALLNTLGINDLILRQVAILLRPDLFLVEELPRAETSLSTRQQLVRQLCEHMKGHIAEPLTMKDLENHSGLSARTIQYAFMHIHACSPMVWLRDQRLVLAQSLLMGRSGLNISQIAQCCGFPNASLFSASYRKKFGVTPSQAMR